MIQKQRQNPIYSVLNRISTKKVEASPELLRSTQAMKTPDDKSYFLISLSHHPESEILDETECHILNHHISVYQSYNDKVFVLSAYHYTATILIDQNHYTLHSYFNKFGALLNILVKNAEEQIVSHLDHWQEIFRTMSQRHTLNVVSEVFHTIESLSSNYDQHLQLINSEINDLSKLLYSPHASSKAIKKHSKNYLCTIQRYIDCQREYNEVSLNRNHKIINFLQGILAKFKPPEIRRQTDSNSTLLSTKTNEKSPGNKKLIKKVKKPTIVLNDVKVPLIPLDIQNYLTRLEHLEQKNTADNILEQYTILKTCSERMNEIPENVAIDIFIKQNTLLKKSRVALMMYLQIGDVESVRLLLPLTPYVNQAMIASAAMKGHTLVLTLLLNGYKGPKRFFHHVDEFIIRELICDEKLPTASLQALLNFGCDKRSIDVYGRSLLLIAVMLDDPLRVKMLIDAKIDVNLHTRKDDHNVILQPIITFAEGTHLTKKTTLSIQKSLSRLQAVQAAHLNQSTPKMTLTPIMCATQRTSLDIIKLLCEAGCDLYEADDNGINAFGSALIRPVTNPHYRLKEDFIRYFIDECHMDINMLHGPEDIRRTALHHAISFRNFSDSADHAAAILNDIAVLLKYHADPNVLSLDKLDTDGTQPLSAFCQAVILDHSDIVELIFQNSQVLLTSETIKHATVIIQSRFPDRLSDFRMQYSRHFNRLVPPLPSIAQDPNRFFNDTTRSDIAEFSNPFEKGSN